MWGVQGWPRGQGWAHTELLGRRVRKTGKRNLKFRVVPRVQDEMLANFYRFRKWTCPGHIHSSLFAWSPQHPRPFLGNRAVWSCGAHVWSL